MALQKITADLSELPRKFGPDIPAGRVETGALQINDDWPGIYVRGDNAAWHAMQSDILLENYTNGKNNGIDRITLSGIKSLRNLLLSCNIRNISSTDNLDISDSVDDDGA